MADKPKKELGGTNQMSLSTKVIIVVFAIIMALSMMLPSLASVFASNTAAEEQEQQDGSEDSNDSAEDSANEDADDTADDAEASNDEESSDEEATDDAQDGATDVPDNETLQSLAEQYGDRVASFEDRLESQPNNLAALLNLGQVYMNWGYSAVYSSSTDEETAYSQDLLNKAIEYFDRYLALNDSKAVKVDRALCEFYLGETQEATEALQTLTEDYPDYALAWANLGMLYESQYDYESASAAYRQAVDTDVNDEYGAASYANQRLISLNSTVSSPGDAGEASADDISTQPESGLTSTLASDSGVGF